MHGDPHRSQCDARSRFDSPHRFRRVVNLHRFLLLRLHNAPSVLGGSVTDNVNDDLALLTVAPRAANGLVDPLVAVSHAAPHHPRAVLPVHAVPGDTRLGDQDTAVVGESGQADLLGVVGETSVQVDRARDRLGERPRLRVQLAPDHPRLIRLRGHKLRDAPDRFGHR